MADYALIKDSTNGLWLDVDYRDCVLHKKGKDECCIQKSLIISIALIENDQGVEIEVSGAGSYMFVHAHVDEVGTETSITTNAILYAELKNLI